MENTEPSQLNVNKGKIFSQDIDVVMAGDESPSEKQKEAQSLVLQKGNSTIAQTQPLGEKPMTGFINMA